MKKNEYLGMEIGNGIARFAVVNTEKFNVSSTIEVRWEADEEITDSQTRLKNQYEAIKKSADKLPAGKEMVICLPPDDVFIRYINLPSMKAAEQETALRTRVLKYFPISKDRHSFTYIDMPPLTASEKQKGYLAIVARKDEMDKQVDLLRMQGFHVAHVDIPHLAIVRWLLLEDPSLEKGNHMFISIGDENLMIGAFINKMLYMVKTITPPLFKTPEWKTGGVDKNVEVLKPFIREMISEIKMIVTYARFRTIPSELNIESIILAGRCDDNKILSTMLLEELGIPIKVVTPKKLQFEQAVDKGKSFAYEVAAGLSLRILEESIWQS